MKKYELLLSAQRALLGMITSNMRAITVGYVSDTFVLRIYFHSKPSELEIELMGDIMSEVLADLNETNSYKEEPIVTQAPRHHLEPIDTWVYIRYEA